MTPNETPISEEAKQAETPRTDAHFAQIQTAKQCAAFARTLEREIATLTAQLATVTQERYERGRFIQHWKARYNIVESQRDAARAELAEVSRQRDEAKQRIDMMLKDWEANNNQWLLERDTLRASLAQAHADAAAMREALEKKAAEWESSASWMGIPKKQGPRNITDCAADIHTILTASTAGRDLRAGLDAAEAKIKELEGG